MHFVLFFVKVKQFPNIQFAFMLGKGSTPRGSHLLLEEKFFSFQR